MEEIVLAVFTSNERKTAFVCIPYLSIHGPLQRFAQKWVTSRKWAN